MASQMPIKEQYMSVFFITRRRKICLDPLNIQLKDVIVVLRGFQFL